jgi:hypothetical protein
VNTTPRALNRFVLAVVGLLVLAAGASGLALLASPAVASWWGTAAPRVGMAIDGVRAGTTLEGQDDTWLWIALAAALLLVVVMLVLWVAAQGRGRTGLFAAADEQSHRGRGDARSGSDGDDGGDDGGADGAHGDAVGTVTITAGAVEQTLRSALLDRSDLAGASVSTWLVRGTPGLKVRVLPRKGVPPYAVAEEVSRLVEALDAVTGYRTPVLISITTGARVRFTRTERVA